MTSHGTAGAGHQDKGLRSHNVVLHTALYYTALCLSYNGMNDKVLTVKEGQHFLVCQGEAVFQKLL